MQFLAADCIGAVVKSLNAELAGRNTQSFEEEKEFNDALGSKVAESAVVLSRLASLIRATCALQLPNADNTAVVIATPRRVYVSSFVPDSPSIMVPSLTARESLRMARKRLRAEDSDADIPLLHSLQSYTLAESLQFFAMSSDTVTKPSNAPRDGNPALGGALKSIREAQEEERSVLLCNGRIGLVTSPNQPLSAKAARYESLARAADVMLSGEYLTLVTRAQLGIDLTDMETAFAGSLDKPIKVLSIRNGVASLSLRGMCILDVRYVESNRRWELIGFIWTIFDLTASQADESGQQPILSMAHTFHQQIVQRVTIETSSGLMRGIVAALRCCCAAVLQHVHNRFMVATRGNSAPLAIDGYACWAKSDVSQRNASITLFCQPTSDTNQPKITVKMLFDVGMMGLVKCRQIGTDVDSELKQIAMPTLPLDVPSEVSSYSSRQVQQLQAIHAHLLENKARLAGLVGTVPDSEYRRLLPPMTGASVVFIDMAKLLSPVL